MRALPSITVRTAWRKLVIRDWMTVSSRSLMTPKVSVPVGDADRRAGARLGMSLARRAQLELGVVPAVVGRERRREVDPLAKEPFVVGDELALDVADAHLHARTRQRVAVDALVRVDQVAPERVRLGRAARSCATR